MFYISEDISSKTTACVLELNPNGAEDTRKLRLYSHAKSSGKLLSHSDAELVNCIAITKDFMCAL